MRPFNACAHAKTPLIQAVLPTVRQHGASLVAISSGLNFCRGYAVQAGGKPVFDVFNRRSKWLQKERAAANVDASRQADYLKDEVAIRLCERLLVCCDFLLPLSFLNCKGRVKFFGMRFFR